MFKNPIIIWHQPTAQKNLFTEKRLIHAAAPSMPATAAAAPTGTGFKASMISGWSKVKGFGRSVGGLITSRPVRWTLFPATMATMATIKAVKWTYGKAARYGRFGMEVGMGIKEATVDPLWRLLQAPLIFLKKNLIDNIRDGVKAILSTPFTVGMALYRTPGNIFRIPKNLFLGAKNAISDTRKKVGDTIKHISELSPIKAIGDARRSITSLLAMPFKTAASPLKPLIYEPAKEIVEPHAKMVINIKDSLMAYPKSIYSTEAGKEGAFNKFISGSRRIISAWAATVEPAVQPAEPAAA